MHGHGRARGSVLSEAEEEKLHDEGRTRVEEETGKTRVAERQADEAPNETA